MSNRDETLAGLAGVLDAHGCEYGVCACGETPASLAEHQAAVVLAHLEAQGWAQGREEWGYRYWSSEVTGFTSRAKAEDHIAKNAPNRLEPIEGMPDYPLEAVLIRRRVTEWEQV